MLAVDPERAGEADRHLRDAGEVLDVALEDVRVERVMREVREPGPGEGLRELLPLRDDAGREVVLLQVGDVRPALGHPLQGVLHLHLEGAERPGVDRDLDLVGAQLEAHPPGVDLRLLAERERLRPLGADRGGRHRLPVAQVHEHLGERDLAPVDDDAKHPEDGRIRQPVLEPEGEPDRILGERAEGVQLAKDEAGNAHGRRLRKRRAPRDGGRPGSPGNVAPGGREG